MLSRQIVVIALWLGFAGLGHAGEVAVEIGGARAGEGLVSCALFAGPRGFPLDYGAAVLQRANGGRCRYRDLKPGSYAVAVAQLPPGQAGVAKNILGQPVNPWGVSHNVRHAFSAPTFAEAAFSVPATGEIAVAVELAK